MTAAVFRADASPAIGGGHVMRCLALAGELRGEGWETAFACSPETTATMPFLVDSGHAIVDVAEDDADHLARHWPGGTDWLVVDHYGLDAEFESRCRPWARRVLVIDDLADRPHDCDVLLDQNFGRQHDAYGPLVSETCRLLTGAAFALLRPEFHRLRARALDRRRETDGAVTNILVSLGASDPKGVTIRALEGIALSGLPVTVNAVLGAGSADTEGVSALFASNRLQGAMHINTPEIAELMVAADLAIGAGGSTSWERCCLGLPGLIVNVADNQRFITEQLVKAGACFAMADDASAGDFAMALTNLAARPDMIRRMSEASRKICDGRGTERIYAEITEKAA